MGKLPDKKHQAKNTKSHPVSRMAQQFEPRPITFAGFAKCEAFVREVSYKTHAAGRCRPSLDSRLCLPRKLNFFAHKTYPAMLA